MTSAANLTNCIGALGAQFGILSLLLKIKFALKNGHLARPRFAVEEGIRIWSVLVC
jgi:hypothetical protein